MPSQNYKEASSSYSAATEYGVSADRYRAKGRADERIGEIKRDQMHTAFGAISETIGIGKNLWDVYSYNDDLIDKGKEYGLEVTSGWLGNLFGTPEFKNKEGKDVSAEIVGAASQWEQFYKGKDLLGGILENKYSNKKESPPPSKVSQSGYDSLYMDRLREEF